VKEKPEQDTDLFRQALEGVTPLPAPDRIVTTSSKPRRKVASSASPNDASPVADNLSDHGVGDVAITEFLRPGLKRMTLRKLRHGDWPIQDELDLHGLNKDDARKLLMEFLHEATQQRLRCVGVIHGKGWRSGGRDGIIKIHARHWLAQHPQVLAFCEMPPQAGGSGAVRVLLKSSQGAENTKGS
jgi:DNA-nicking Smr family endonuclease